MILSIHCGAFRWEQSQDKGHPLTLGGNTNRDATYHAVHIRRGDFQYSFTQLPAKQIWANIRPLLNASISPILYVATDEKVRQSVRILFSSFGLDLYIVQLPEFINLSDVLRQVCARRKLTNPSRNWYRHCSWINRWNACNTQTHSHSHSGAICAYGVNRTVLSLNRFERILLYDSYQ